MTIFKGQIVHLGHLTLEDETTVLSYVLTYSMEQSPS